jgi:hypothetical protein
MTINNEEIERILLDNSASYWLKNALKSALPRDSVDAANDAEVLFTVLNKRANDALKTFTKFSV